MKKLAKICRTSGSRFAVGSALFAWLDNGFKNVYSVENKMPSDRAYGLENRKRGDQLPAAISAKRIIKF